MQDGYPGVLDGHMYNLHVCARAVSNKWWK